MATVNLTDKNFDEMLEKNDIIILDFWASWCGPCKSFAPIFEAASEAHTDVVFAKVNTEEQQELAAAFGIRAIPTVVVLREQIPVFMQPGMLPPQALEDILGQVKKLDMAEVRAEYERYVASQAAGGAASAPEDDE
jgi:thioredoxin 1